MRVGLGFVGSLLGMAAAQGAALNPHRVYGPRVYTAKDMGETSKKHLRSNRYLPITAEDAPTMRECIRRRRQMERVARKSA